MDKLRAIKDSHGQVMQTNVRPVQPLNSRKVQYGK
jgi:carbonic anhydrase